MEDTSKRIPQMLMVYHHFLTKMVVQRYTPLNPMFMQTHALPCRLNTLFISGL